MKKQIIIVSVLALLFLGGAGAWAAKVFIAEQLYVSYISRPVELESQRWYIESDWSEIPSGPYKGKKIPVFSEDNQLYNIFVFLSEVISYAYEKNYDKIIEDELPIRINLYGQSHEGLQDFSETVRKLTGQPLVKNMETSLVQYNEKAIGLLFDKLYIPPQYSFMGMNAQLVYNISFREYLRKYLYILGSVATNTETLEKYKKLFATESSHGGFREIYWAADIMQVVNAGLDKDSLDNQRMVSFVQRRYMDGTLKTILDRAHKLLKEYDTPAYSPTTLVKPGALYPNLRLSESPHLLAEILKSGTDVNKLTREGYSALHLSTIRAEPDAAKLLLENNIDRDMTTPEGNTALHIAASYGNIKMVSILLKSGAQLSIRNKEGKTALDIAIDGSKGRLERKYYVPDFYRIIIRMLKKAEREAKKEAKKK
ncbi:MAG: ankyrin repeat domain-containing protein [Leptospirales bacterium]